jgi:hypothetical protein
VLLLGDRLCVAYTTRSFPPGRIVRVVANMFTPPISLDPDQTLHLDQKVRRRRRRRRRRTIHGEHPFKYHGRGRHF